MNNERQLLRENVIIKAYTMNILTQNNCLYTKTIQSRFIANYSHLFSICHIFHLPVYLHFLIHQLKQRSGTMNHQMLCRWPP